MDKLGALLGRGKEFWGTLKRWQKLSLVGASAFVFFSLIALAFLVGRDRYEPLFAGLEVADQSVIVSYLKEQKIPYKNDPAANAILVPQDLVYETRLALAGQGIPKGGVVGFELFDQSKMGMSDFQQKVTYVRALEGELARTIGQIDAVEYARVSIVVPEPRLFLEQQQPSTASVLVKLREGRTVGQEQVKAIVNLVARSVEGLKPEDITVVDTTGKVLSDLIQDDTLVYGADGQGVSSVQRELERQQEQEMEAKVRAMLEKVFGPGKVVVRVRMDLDFDKRSVARKEFIPNPNGKGVVRSQQNVDESYTGPGLPPGGAPGTTTNIPGYALNAGGTGNVEYNKSDTTTNYDITTQESEQVATPGTVKRLSASVLVDSNLTKPQVDQLQASVGAAVGFDPKRGDQLVISGMKFDTTLADSLLAQLASERRQRLLVAAAIGLVLALLIGAGGFLWWRRLRLARLASLVPKEGGESAPSLRDLLEHPELMTSQGEAAILEEQLRVYAMNNPEEVATLIKNWLAEDI